MPISAGVLRKAGNLTVYLLSTAVRGATPPIWLICKERVKQLLHEFLKLDPAAHAAQVDAVNFALRLAAEHIARSWVERPPEPGDASTSEAE